jgi:hypothetical protein
MVLIRFKYYFLSICFLLITPGQASSQGDYIIQFVKNDVIAFIGEANTFELRRHGYMEAVLTTRFYDKNLKFRNMGWQGDTVFEQNRMPNFGPYENYFERHGITRVFSWFGLIESFAGSDGLFDFDQAYRNLLERLEDHTDKFVFLGPIRVELLHPKVKTIPNLNESIRIYSEHIRMLAEQFNSPYIEVNTLIDKDEDRPITDNGTLLNGYGQWLLAHRIDLLFKNNARNWHVEMDVANKNQIQTEGTQITNMQVSENVLHFQTHDKFLPLPKYPGNSNHQQKLISDDRSISISGLTTGTWQLYIDNEFILEANNDDWANKIFIDEGPEFNQVDSLMVLINKKNDFFYRQWRPKNWDFIYGERMGVPAGHHHEIQDKRIFPSELAEYTALIKAKEEEIQILANPIRRDYKLVRVNGGQ